MSNEFSSDAVVSRLASQSKAVGQLAQDSGAFAAAVAAFESKDPDAFRWVLNHQEMLPYCELICDWVRVKMCVLRCFEVCGLPQEVVKAVDLQQFASAIVQLASNEKLLRRVVDAVSCGDGDDYRAAINELKLNDYCHLLCHWVCAIIYRRVCERICTPIREPLADAASEIRAASSVFAKLIKNEKAIQDISKAAVALDCDFLRETIEVAGFAPWCELICCWICVWWCAYACREVCGVPNPARIELDEIEEARNFALASRKIASQPRAMDDLVQAVRNRDTKAYAAIVARYGLGPYCYQLCAWVCSGICYEFCICVCPPSVNPPLFLDVGLFDIYNDIDQTSGLTSVQKPKVYPMSFGGGKNFAFFDQLQLGGWCPATSPSDGTPMMFRFLYAKNLTTLSSPVTSAAQSTIVVASNAGIPAPPFNISVCYLDGLYENAEIMRVTGGTATKTWNVTRGQDASTAAAFIPAGATVALDPLPITGSLVDTPVLVGQTTVNWPNHIGLDTKPGFKLTTADVYVGPGTTTLPPPVGLGNYVPPEIYIQPNVTTGWVDIEQNMAVPGVTIFFWFDSAQATPATCELVSPPCFGKPGGAPAGTAVPGPNQEVGTDLTIIFQASRTAVPTPADYSNSLCEIHVNNLQEVNNLWFVEFDTPGTTCCTPINSFLSTQFTVDHEMIDSGGWSLSITSCSKSAPGDITPAVSISAQNTTLTSAIDKVVTSIPVASVAGFPSTPFILDVGTETMIVTSHLGLNFNVVRGENGTAAAAPFGATATYPGLTLTARGGAGTIVEDTSTWTNCSYQVWLNTRPGRTSGLWDDQGQSNLLTFCICGHESLLAQAAAVQAKKR